MADFFINRVINLAEAENDEMRMQISRRGLGDIPLPAFDPNEVLPSAGEVLELYRHIK